MNDEAFLETIRQNPEDDAPRLVYADWLEEQGDLRAEFLRLEVQWARRRQSPLNSPVWKRMEQLRAKIDSNWLAWIERAKRFSVYCSNDLCQTFATRGEIGKPLRFLVSGYNFFTHDFRGVAHGDYLYPITVRKKRLHVIARMRVREVSTTSAYLTARPDEAAVLLEPSAGDILIGEGGALQRLDRRLPFAAVARLRFRTEQGERALEYQFHGLLLQSFDLQGLYELTLRSAMDFERLLAGMPFPDLPEEASLFG
jgi:uncharacterized protein (TIGR02996 family)